jgi:hypothetical protein
MPSPGRCTTDEEQTPQRLHTMGDDATITMGPRA